MSTTPNPSGAPDATNLHGLVAVVTGAASGIGRATALLLAGRGAAVFAVDRNGDGLATLAGEGGALKGRIAIAAHDLLEQDAPTAIFRQCAQELGRPNGLANIAGVGNPNSIEQSSDQEFHDQIALNLGTAYRMSREAVGAFAEKGGAIVNVSTTFALIGAPGFAAYAAAKAGVAGLTRQLAAEYGRRDIRVNAVAPGLIETPVVKERMAAARGFFDDAVVKSRPLLRNGTPEDVAAVIAFLLSADAGFITGVVLPVCGGWSTTKYRDLS